MRTRQPRDSIFYGVKTVPVSRYFALYFAQAGWLLLGAYLFSKAYWPSTCTPGTLFQVYGCSVRLPETRNWVETALLTWLWSTPILLALEVSRRMNAFKNKRR